MSWNLGEMTVMDFNLKPSGIMFKVENGGIDAITDAEAEEIMKQFREAYEGIPPGHGIKIFNRKLELIPHDINPESGEVFPSDEAGILLSLHRFKIKADDDLIDAVNQVLELEKIDELTGDMTEPVIFHCLVNGEYCITFGHLIPMGMWEELVMTVEERDRVLENVE